MTSRRCCWSRRIGNWALLAATLAAVPAWGGGPQTEAPLAIDAPLGLPAVPFPPHNPPTAAKVELGRKLFFDRRLSFNGAMSCAMCHMPEQGFTSNELRTPVGSEGASVRRNAPTLLNVAYHPRLFHDGRDGALETQVWGPLLAPDEMANPSLGHVLDRLRALPDYAGLFETAFAGRGASADRVGEALASYQRTLVSGDSRFDRYRYGNANDALDSEERLGLAIFTGKGRCASCHLIGERAALFSDFRYHNTGIGWLRGKARPEVEFELAPGISATMSAATVRSIGAVPRSDLGRFEITLDPQDRWAYKTPMLRDVAATSPYMHDGSLPTLAAVVEYYDRGGAGAPDQSPLIAPLHLSAEEKAALVAFLKTLGGRNAHRQGRDKPGIAVAVPSSSM
ncbi:cytochrome-c peroxidase [Thauera phenolivorans]|uniref:cytochrome-c peroxidase n=1 Tax=Thauera phenolivorans TaxID=1792543 RepID=UPI0009F1C6CC|nr:cytochrome c peroxidase [Thauera phenolivorans]